MTRGKSSSEPADRKPSISVTLFPWEGHSVATVDVASWDSAGRHVSRLAYWHLDLKRSDLAGKSTDDVLRLLCKRILRRLESGPDPADQVAGRQGTRPQAPAPLEGPQGEEIPQTALPGL